MNIPGSPTSSRSGGGDGGGGLLSSVFGSFKACFGYCGSLPCWPRSEDDEHPMELLDDFNAFTLDMSDEEDEERKVVRNNINNINNIVKNSSMNNNITHGDERRIDDEHRLQQPVGEGKGLYHDRHHKHKNSRSNVGRESFDEDMDGDELEFDTGSFGDDADQGVILFSEAMLSNNEIRNYPNSNTNPNPNPNTNNTIPLSSASHISSSSSSSAPELRSDPLIQLPTTPSTLNPPRALTPPILPSTSGGFAPLQEDAATF